MVGIKDKIDALVNGEQPASYERKRNYNFGDDLGKEK